MIHELLIDKSAIEKANIKATEIAKLDLSGKYTDPIYGITLEIQNWGKIPGGIQVFAKAWKGKKQLGFGDGTVEIERIRIFNPPILVPDPNGLIVRVGISSVDGTEQIHRYTEDPVQAIQKSLAHTIKVSAKSGKNIIPGKTGNTVSTFNPAAGANSPVDGVTNDNVVLGSGTSWAIKIAAAGTGAFDSGLTGDSENEAIAFRFTSDNVTDKWVNLSRAILLFDTSAIPDTDTISAATMSVIGTAKSDVGVNTPNANIYASAPASNAALVAGDFTTLGSTAFATAVTYANLTSDSATFTDFTFNAAGRSNISQTGVSKFGIRNANYDVAAVSPTWGDTQSSAWYIFYADVAGTSQDPKLVVTHSGAIASNFLLMGVGT